MAHLFIAPIIVLSMSPLDGTGQHSAIQKLTLSQIEELVSHGVPDSTMSTQIQKRGLAFTPTPAILDELRTKGAGPLTLAAIKESHPTISSSEEWKKPTITATAEPPSVSAGQPATLSWKSSFATRVTLNGKPVPLSGSQTVSPSTTTAYLFSAINPEGKTVTESVTVTVVPSAPAPTISLQANALSIPSGQPVMLTWQSTNASSVSINGTPEPLSGSQAFTPSQSITYQAIATSPTGPKSGVKTAVKLMFCPCFTAFAERLCR